MYVQCSSASCLLSNPFLHVGGTQLDLAGLSVIHVTGTKGKGSTCAMVESVLRHHGFRTGTASNIPAPSCSLAWIKELLHVRLSSMDHLA